MSSRIKLIVIGAFVGALCGYAYYYFVGCKTGSCAITSSPVNSSVYGLFMGGLTLDLIRDLLKKKK